VVFARGGLEETKKEPRNPHLNLASKPFFGGGGGPWAGFTLFGKGVRNIHPFAYPKKGEDLRDSAEKKRAFFVGDAGTFVRGRKGKE